MTVNLQRVRARGASLRFDLARFAPQVILAGYGALILSLFARNVLSWYINPVYIVPTTLAGAVLVVLALAGLMRTRHPAESPCEGDDCSALEPSPRIWTYGILAVPLFLGLFFPPRSLAAFSANQRGLSIAGTSMVHGVAAVRRVSLSVDTRSFSMSDWVGALSADPNPRDYLGKPVTVSGIVVHNSASVPPGYIMVIRYFVTCCIADARPVGLIVDDTSHGALKDNQWVSVTGTMRSASYQGQKVAVVQPKSLVPTRSQSPYIY
jgi:uncharacterized repeat protein (TIGR03943 family)